MMLTFIISSKGLGWNKTLCEKISAYLNINIEFSTSGFRHYVNTLSLDLHLQSLKYASYYS